MKKPLIQLIKEAGLAWPEGANYAAQDKLDARVYFYKSKPCKASKGDIAWWYPYNELTSVSSALLPELCKKWRKTLITKEEYLGAD